LLIQSINKPEAMDMRKFLMATSVVALFALPSLASAQEGTAAGVATGAVTGAIVGGPVGAAIGAGVGGIAGGVAEQNAKSNPPNRVYVVPDATTTGTVTTRERTCVQDTVGNQTCQEIVR
jgi:phage tail tape-measure protein